MPAMWRSAFRTLRARSIPHFPCDSDYPLVTVTALRRDIGLPGAILLGLGSMIGTGVFVSLGLAAGVAERGLMAAILFAALLAMANALSSAQLAAAHPVSGGTYEYGRRYLTPSLGFAAGWTFLCAKSASAATAALGASGYMLALAESIRAQGDGAATASIESPTPSAFVNRSLALLCVVVVTALVASGVRRSNRVNAVIVCVTLITLSTLIVFAWNGTGAPSAPTDGPTATMNASAVDATPLLFGAPSLAALLQATALMFVAFTGYGRLATLGEEVRDPRRVIPRAIVITMLVVAALYLLVARVSLGVVRGSELARAATERAAPLELVCHALNAPWLARVIAIGAVTAMLGVLLNLILGLSRVVLAMARHGDAPPVLARISAHRASPVAAVVVCGAGIAVLVLAGSVKLAWSLSAFTVLLYYAITNLAALRLPEEDRRFPRVIAVAGLCACLGLAWWVEWRAWVAGLVLVAIGFALRTMLRGAMGRAVARA